MYISCLLSHTAAYSTVEISAVRIAKYLGVYCHTLTILYCNTFSGIFQPLPFYQNSRKHSSHRIMWPKLSSFLKLSRLDPDHDMNGRPMWKNIVFIVRCFTEASRGCSLPVCIAFKVKSSPSFPQRWTHDMGQGGLAAERKQYVISWWDLEKSWSRDSNSGHPKDSVKFDVLLKRLSAPTKLINLNYKHKKLYAF